MNDYCIGIERQTSAEYYPSNGGVQLEAWLGLGSS